MPEIAYVNGEFLPLERAMVHVEDRGFQFADSVYEVLRTYGGRPFAMDEHLARLFRSLQAIEIRHNLTADKLNVLINEAIGRAGFAEAVVYLQITRGRAPRHRGMPSEYEPTLVVTVRELASAERLGRLQQTGVSVVTTLDNRWGRCDIKSVALLANVLAYNAARNSDAHDAVFVEADGTVTEASAGNIFVVHEGKLRTPPKGPRILPGVTRDKILEAARAAGIPSAEERVTKKDLMSADEIFLTSTTAEVVPVVTVDGEKVGAGTPGPITDQLYKQFVRMYVKK